MACRLQTRFLYPGPGRGSKRFKLLREDAVGLAGVVFCSILIKFQVCIQFVIV